MVVTGGAVVLKGGVGVSVVVSPAHHLLAGGPEKDGVLELSSVAALGVAQGRVGVHDAQVTQVLQGHQVLALAETVQPAPAERQRAEVLVHYVQQVLRSGQPVEEGGKKRSVILPERQTPRPQFKYSVFSYIMEVNDEVSTLRTDAAFKTARNWEIGKKSISSDFRPQSLPGA